MVSTYVILAVQEHNTSRLFFFFSPIEQGVFWCFSLPSSPSVSLAGQQNFFEKKSKISRLILSFTDVTQGSEVHQLASAIDLCGWPVLSHLWVLKHPCWPRPLLSSLYPLVVPHTKVMMTTRIKKSFNSDFLYLAYPSSEKSCHSNELASQMWWKKGEMEEGEQVGGGESLSKALPVRRVLRSRKRRSPSLAIFKLKCRTLWSPLLFLSSP